MSLRPLEFFIALAIAFVAYRITRNMAVFTGVLVLLIAAIVSATGGPAWMVGWLLGLLALSAARHLPATLKAWQISRSKGEGLLAFLRDRSPGQPSMGAGEG